MKLHDLKPDPGSKRKRKRVGRGIAAGQGKTAGRGHKGQGARSGGSGKGPYFEGGQLPLVRRLPFKRGFTNIFAINFQEVNVDMLDQRFEDGAVVNGASLAAAGLVRKADEPIKVLGRGELGVKLEVHANKFSKSAAAKIEKAGGSVTAHALKVTGARATVKRLPKADMERLYGDAD
ncbi:MAG: 50S ribosomal protein L15 [Chloroflexi bacterium]|nr:50S ribosomal protein L15 [Chloroflexota bacterium]MCY3978814.1 50S ribosomal protein L15 [Chloroflexota bacterium]MDE2638666.1 50S ribosomal protein L15 [Chloroflexota bacterium]MYE27186.1 50S ribosomal protein L15 [Chloroflexota bacterium]